MTILFEWLANYLVHSTALLGLALLSGRLPLLRDASWQDAIWKAAVLAGLVTATIQTASPAGSPWRLAPVVEPASSAVAATAPAAAAIATASTSDLERVRSTTERAPRSGPSGAPPRHDDRAALDPPIETSTAGHGAAVPAAVAQHLAVGAWLATALVLVAGLVGQLRAERLLLADRRPVAGAARGRLCAGFPLPSTVRLAASDRIAAPVATRGREIVVPAAFGALPEAQRVAALAHELAHLRRADPQWRLALLLIARVLFIQPLNALAARELARRAETLSDRLAVRASGGRARPLAECLAHFAGVHPGPRRGAPPTPATLCAMAATRLPERIAALLAGDSAAAPAGRSPWLLVLAGAVTGALMLPGVSDGQGAPAADVDARPDRQAASAETDASAAPVAAEAPIAPTPTPRARPAPARKATAVGGLVPAAPTAPLTLAPRAPGEPSEVRVRVDERQGRLTYAQRERGLRFEVLAEGAITFSDDFDDIVAIEDGGRFVVERSERGELRSLELRGRSGRSERRYEVDGRAQPWDDAARGWFAGTLLEVFRVTGLAAERRAAWLLAQGGVAAVLTELEAITSDAVARRYVAGLAGQATLSRAELDRLLSYVGQAIASDLEQRLALGAVMASQALDASAWVQLLASTARIGSDLEQRLVLTEASELMPSDRQVLGAFLDAVDGIGSDLERRLALGAVIDRLAGQDDGLPVAAIQAIDGIGSDLEHRLALAPIAAYAENLAVAEAYVRSAAAIGSDLEARLAFTALTEEADLEDPALVALIDAAAGSIGSDLELRLVLAAVLDRGEPSAPVREALVRALPAIGSSFERNLIAERLLD